jgi:histone acetyltransferase (RNA polymerase elongator complex component)
VKIYPFFIPHGGCPHRCLFCQQNRVTGTGAALSPSQVGAELDRMLPERGDGEVAFFGGTFTLLPEDVQQAYLEQVVPFVQAGRVSGTRLSTRPDALTGAGVERLKKFGVTTVELGCQSFRSEVLLLARRGHGPAAAATAVPMLRDRGMKIGLQLMPGLPGADRNEARFSLACALDLAPDFLRIYPTVVLRETGLEKAWRGGNYIPWSLEEAVECCADLLAVCRRERMPVIRLGLQGSVELEQGGSLVAGPYHPAFGQLVRSRLWRRAVERVFRALGPVEIRVHPADLADVLGHRRQNHAFLEERYGRFAIVTHREVERETFVAGDRFQSLVDLAETGDGWFGESVKQLKGCDGK